MLFFKQVYYCFQNKQTQTHSSVKYYHVQFLEPDDLEYSS